MPSPKCANCHRYDVWRHVTRLCLYCHRASIGRPVMFQGAPFVPAPIARPPQAAARREPIALAGGAA